MRDEVKSLSAFLFFVLTSSAALNMQLYWSRFGIDPFMFINASNLIPIIGPFFVQAVGILSGVYISFLIFPPKTAEEIEKLEKEQQDIKKYVIPIWVVSLFVSIVAFYYSNELGSYKTMMVFMGILSIKAVFFKYIVRLKEWEVSFKTQFSRRTAAFSAVYFPMAAIILAFISSNEILSNKSHIYVNSNDLADSIKKSEDIKLPFLGKLGETYVFTSSDFKEKIFLESSNFKILRFNSYEEK